LAARERLATGEVRGDLPAATRKFELAQRYEAP
jgi:hypothetical protein